MTTQGTKILFVNVKDSASNVKTSENISVVVNNSALKVTLKVNGSTANTQLNVGESVKHEPVVTGGAGGYTYQYIMKTSASPNGMILKNFSIQSSYTGLLTSVGTKIFSVSVKDKAGNIVVSDDVTVNVVKGIKVVLKVNDSTSDINLAVGGSVTLVPVVTGGEGKYTYQYLMTNANTGSSIILKNFSTQTSYTGPLTSAGTKIFTVNVKDSSGNVVSSNSVVVTVTNSSAKVVLKVNGSSSDISLKVGQSVTLQPVVTGVTGNCTYQYVMTNVNTGSTIVLNNFSAQTSYTGPLTSAGQKIFKVNVKDSSGNVVSSNSVVVTVTNSSAKVVLKVNGNTSGISLNVGQSVTLQPVVTGVTGSCTYQYVMTNVNTGSTIVLKNFSAQTSYTGPLTSAGQKIFKVNVKDSSGVTIGSNTIKVTVVK